MLKCIYRYGILSILLFTQISSAKDPLLIEAERDASAILVDSEAIHALAFSSDDAKILISSGEKSLESWDIKTLKRSMVFKGSGSEINVICLAAKGETIVSAEENGAIRTWDANSGKEIKNFKNDGKAIRSLFAIDESTDLLAGGDSETITLWNYVSGESIRSFGRIPGQVRCVFAPNGGKLFVAASVPRLTLCNL